MKRLTSHASRLTLHAVRIAIDYTAAVGQGAGIGRYTRGLVGALADLDQQNRYTLLIAGGVPRGRALPSLSERFSYRTIPFSDRLLTILWHRLRLPLYADLWAGGADLFHMPDFALPPLRSARGLVTVHDLTFMHYPECAPPRLVSYLNKVVPRSVRRARLVLADSTSTKQDLVTLLNVPADKIRVVYAGVGPEFHRIADEAALAAARARYGLDLPFILTLGTLEPRKNHLRLLEAFARVRRGTNDSSPAAGAHDLQSPVCDLRLVIAGGKGWLYDEVLAAVQRLGLQDRVVFPGFVADADLPALYSLAAAFAYPSLYEGFGLPVLEALACGTPVVCSNASSLPEVAGDAALLVDPLSVDNLTAALQRILNDAPLRQELAARGPRQAARFTWSAAAESLLAAYREAGAREA